jgi:DNA repair exonuclease SbcCD ATPase subunit
MPPPQYSRSKSAPAAVVSAELPPPEEKPPETLITAPWRAPSFRDLQRTCSYLQAKLEDARAHNDALTSQLEEMRSKSRNEAALSGRLMQDVESSASSARVSEAALSQEKMHRREAEIDAATLRQTAEHQEDRLHEAEAREERMFTELAEAREGVARARADVADLRAENAAVREALRQCHAEREEAMVQLSAAQTSLTARSNDLAAERSSLAACRNATNALKTQCSDASRALQAARASNAALLHGLQQKEEECERLRRKGQEAAADALGEAEARASAERTVFALREQVCTRARHSVYPCTRAALRARLALLLWPTCLRRCMPLTVVRAHGGCPSLQVNSLNEQKASLQRRVHMTEAAHQHARGETVQASREAQALALRMGLYKAVLKSDMAGVVATVC